METRMGNQTETWDDGVAPRLLFRFLGSIRHLV